ncbi:MAG: 2-hydroxymuconate tautomerase family protein [Erythrobacter sp.]|nr:2-hydroxymuconate tautomerase family protein [Erythrobacter sp.]
MPVVTVQMRKGRSKDAKRALMRNVTDAVVDSIGADRGKVRVLIYEVDDADWSVGGISYEDQAKGEGI